MCRMVHIGLRRDPKVVHPVPHPGSLSWDEAGTLLRVSVYVPRVYTINNMPTLIELSTIMVFLIARVNHIQSTNTLA